MKKYIFILSIITILGCSDTEIESTNVVENNILPTQTPLDRVSDISAPKDISLPNEIIPEIKKQENSQNKNLQLAAERIAINMPVQGTAADIIKQAMNDIDRELTDLQLEGFGSTMLLQIHDELIFEVPKTELKRINNIIKEEMTSVVKSDLHSFSIPLTVDINFGENWGILH